MKRMKNRLNQRISGITATTLVVGIDIAKSVHWARFVDCRGVEIGKALAFTCNRAGFESIVAKINEICNGNLSGERFASVIVGMEPTGHYWKTLAHYLQTRGIRVAGVNPYHTKKAKELDDNSPTKSDQKDALTIARLVQSGRYFDPYLPVDVYAELRVLTNTRTQIIRCMEAVKNMITVMIDEYFPEFCGVFKQPLRGKAERQILKSCPFPAQILALDENRLLAEIRKAALAGIGIKRVRALIAAARDSVGVNYGLGAAKLRLGMLLCELELYERQLTDVEAAMQARLEETGYADKLLKIKGIGIVSAASFLGETGNPLRFDSARQIMRYAGLNLTEDSSGKNKSGTSISKRGRAQLRAVLYKMACTLVKHNPEIRTLFRYFITRERNPLKKKQAYVASANKIVAIIYAILKRSEDYDAGKVLGAVRREMMEVA
jgi:transposase